MKRRVVITGMGTVSPNGVGNPAFSEAVLQGCSGVRRISRFDPSEIPVQIAGEVRDFDELAWVEKRERKHVSRVLPLAIAAASEALDQSGVDTATLPLAEPAVAAVLGLFVLGEHLGAVALGGLALLAASLVVLTLPARSR